MGVDRGWPWFYHLAMRRPARECEAEPEVAVKARYWEADGECVRCRLCPNSCLVAPGKAGRCLGRVNRDGVLYAASYGEVVSLAIDPVEKKPLYHFLPGSEILSVATYGCNLRCPFCQNSEISQSVAPARHVTPAELQALARRYGTPSVAFTYNEPTVWFEYLLDAGSLLRDAGVRNVLVTNGMLDPEPLCELLPLVDAMNIDLKSIRPGFYRDCVKGRLDTVLGFIRAAKRRCHIELTNLVIPGRNDSEEELRELVEFVAGLGPETVLHFSRYFPRHRATEPPTPVETLERAAAIAREKLHYVYLGNVGSGSDGRDTFCPNCRNLLVDRSRHAGRVLGVSEGRCGRCGRPADLVL
jgi:pyruvate formate lyase activating enzyme